MRLWTLHPRHLDQRGLVALWREALLAKAVLRGLTRGYRHHPQLTRFRGHPDPVAAINGYLAVVLAEAEKRGYRFDRTKVRGRATTLEIRVSRGQLSFEWTHLLRKLRARAPDVYRLARRNRPRAHPLFRLTAGPVAPWERAPAGRAKPARAQDKRTSRSDRRAAGSVRNGAHPEIQRHETHRIGNTVDQHRGPQVPGR